MIHNIAQLIRSANPIGRTVRRCPAYLLPRLPSPSPQPTSPRSRLLHDGTGSTDANPIAVQMINYALSHARSQKSDESYAQGMIVLEQCLSTHSNEDSLGQDSSSMVYLAMSNLLYERGKHSEAIEHLERVPNLEQSSLAVRAAAFEALVGLHLLSGQDDSSSAIGDKCLELLEKDTTKSAAVLARGKALKGLIELINGNTESAESLFRGIEGQEGCGGNVALSYGEFLHAVGNLSLAKELYEKVIQGSTENKDSVDINALGACNMASEEVLLAATFCLGQLQSHMGNFGEAEETLTRALTKTEEYFGHHHPKVGTVLTGIALMFRNKARRERSSSFLIQEGLYRRALEFLKAPSLESEGTKVEGSDIMALARGGYAELLRVQENRKSEGERMMRWAEAVWRNRRLSLSEALNFSEPSNTVPVIDQRTGRVL